MKAYFTPAWWQRLFAWVIMAVGGATALTGMAFPKNAYTALFETTSRQGMVYVIIPFTVILVTSTSFAWLESGLVSPLIGRLDGVGDLLVPAWKSQLKELLILLAILIGGSLVGNMVVYHLPYTGHIQTIGTTGFAPVVGLALRYCQVFAYMATLTLICDAAALKWPGPLAGFKYGMFAVILILAPVKLIGIYIVFHFPFIPGYDLYDLTAETSHLFYVPFLSIIWVGIMVGVCHWVVNRGQANSDPLSK